MNMLDLIRRYERGKEVHDPIGPSLNEKLRALRRAFGSMPATASGLEIAERAKRHWASAQPGTRLRYLKQLRAVLNYAEDIGALEKAPTIPMPSVHDTREQELTMKQADLLLDHVKLTEGWAYPAVLLLAHSGSRLAEAMRINVREDFTAHGIVVRKPVARKSKTIERVVPYTARMKAALEMGLFNSNPFVSETGVPMKNSAVASAALGRVLRESAKALGLPQSISPHSLRHAFAGMVAECGGSLEDIASLLGHSNTTMAQRYRGLVRPRAEGIVARIGGQ